MPRTKTANKAITDARRNEIIRIATKLFLERGFDQVRISDIAEKVEISQGLLYRYFSDKQKVMLAIVEDKVSEVSDEILNKASSETSAKDNLCAFIKVMIESIYRNPERQQILLLGMRFPGRIHDLVFSLLTNLREKIRELIIEAQKEDSILKEDPEMLSTLLFAILHGLGSSIVLFDNIDSVVLPTWKQIVKIFSDEG